MGQAAEIQGWVAGLDANCHGVRILTLTKAFEMTASGSSTGWYVSPFALKWTVGRTAGARRYHVMQNGEPLTFDSVAEATNFLAASLGVAAMPTVHLGFSGYAQARHPGPMRFTTQHATAANL
jgi:hypothetical protein